MMSEDVRSNIKRSVHYGELQKVVDALFAEDDAPHLAVADPDAAFKVSRLRVVLAAEAADLPEDLLRVVSLLPPGEYTRQRLTDQLNSAIAGHAWGQVYGTVS